jgi:hypothetical protein
MTLVGSLETVSSGGSVSISALVALVSSIAMLASLGCWQAASASASKAAEQIGFMANQRPIIN